MLAHIENLGNNMKSNLIKLFFLPLLVLCESCSVNDPNTDDKFITAKTKISEIESIASEHSSGLVLISIKSKDVQTTGHAEKWQYKYSSGGIAVDYYFHATVNEVLFDSISTTILVGEGFIIHNWFDSDEAMKISEANGGKEFRENNSDYIIEVSLVEPMVPDSETYWFVKYKSGNKILHLGINNSTKEVNLYY